MKMGIASLLGWLTSNTSELGLLLRHVNRTIRNVVAQCSLLTNSSESELSHLCNEVSSHQDRYIPRISEGVAELGAEGSLLKQLSELVSELSFSQNETIDEFEVYLAELVSAKIVNKYYYVCIHCNFISVSCLSPQTAQVLTSLF